MCEGLPGRQLWHLGGGSADEERRLYVVTKGGIVAPVYGELGLAKVVRVDTGAA